MTLDELIFSLINQSPVPIPTIGTRAYPLSAPQRISSTTPIMPYMVWVRIAEEPIELMEAIEALSTNRTHLQFTVYGLTHNDASTAVRTLTRLLINAVDVNHPGLKAVLRHGSRDEWNETERLFGIVAEFTIWDDLG